MWGIWDHDKECWLTRGGDIIAFLTEEAAQQRCAENWGFNTYQQAHDADWCTVKPFLFPYLPETECRTAS